MFAFLLPWLPRHYNKLIWWLLKNAECKLQITSALLLLQLHGETTGRSFFFFFVAIIPNDFSVSVNTETCHSFRKQKRESSVERPLTYQIHCMKTLLDGVWLRVAQQHSLHCCTHCFHFTPVQFNEVLPNPQKLTFMFTSLSVWHILMPERQLWWMCMLAFWLCELFLKNALKAIKWLTIFNPLACFWASLKSRGTRLQHTALKGN